MRILGLQIARVIEFRVNVALVRDVWKETGRTTLPNGVSIIPFAPSYAAAVGEARSVAEMNAFLRMAARGESGWLALEASGHVVGHGWRLDNMGSAVISSSIPVEPGWAYLHYAWVDPACRGQGIGPALMCNCIRQALAINGWSVRGFSVDVAPTNVASQRSVAKLGFVPVRRITSLRIYRRWFVLHSGPAPEDVTRQTGA